ncbi:MAG TPA: hypothetical protein VKA51_06880, partial [Rubrobacteraceae bacterium]|nr:hypothetical protein [Rubrobacteraceae bacterium]
GTARPALLPLLHEGDPHRRRGRQAAEGSAAAEAEAGTTAPAAQDARDGGTPEDAPSPAPQAEAAPEKTAPAAAAPAAAPAGTVSAVGDSVMLGAAATLAQAVPALGVMDAEVGTQVSTGIEILRARRDSGQLGDVVVVHLGNNGTFTAEQFDEMMGVLGDERRVVFVNAKVPRAWEGPNNAVLADGVGRYPNNAVLVDWHAASVGRPGLFWDDGMHLRPKGQKVYADLVASHLQAPEATAATAAASDEAAPAATAAPADSPPGRVAAVGDSVMLGAVDALVQEVPNLAVVDAAGCRQVPAAVDVLRGWRAAGQLGEVVVVHVGSNGPFYPGQFDEMMGVLDGVRRVLVVNVSVPPGVEDPVAVPNNAVLADGVGRYPNNAVLIDWYAASVGHPEYFWEDGTHLTPEGAWAYAGLIAEGTRLAPSRAADSGWSGDPSAPPMVLADAGCPVAP